MIISGRGSIEGRIREEQRHRAGVRRELDIRSGLTKSSGPARGDYKLCREQDKLLNDYRQHKDPNDRAKIKADMASCQREYQHNHVTGKEKVLK